MSRLLDVQLGRPICYQRHFSHAVALPAIGLSDRRVRPLIVPVQHLQQCEPSFKGCERRNRCGYLVQTQHSRRYQQGI